METIGRIIFQIGVIVGTIIPLVWVLGVTFLGKAIEKGKKSLEEKTAGDLRQIEKQFEKAEKAFEEAKETKESSKIKKAQKSLVEIGKQKRISEKALQRIKERYGLLALHKAVVIPFIGSVTLIILGKIMEVNSLGFDIRAVMLGASVVILFLLFKRVFGIMVVIQELSIPSEEASFKQMSEALKYALAEHEKEKEPEIKLDFETPFPREVKVRQEIKVKFKLWLTKGKFVEDAEVLFCAPPEFDFSGGSGKWHQNDDYDIPNALTTKVRIGNMKKGMTEPREITITIPENPGKYPMIYRIYSKEYCSQQTCVEDAFVVTEENEGER